MDARKVSTQPLPGLEGDWVEVPLTAEDIAACEEAEAQIARGEWIDGEAMMAKLNSMIRRHQARATKQD